MTREASRQQRSAELAALMQHARFDYLDAPVDRLGMAEVA
jgi:hypothetical protein